MINSVDFAREAEKTLYQIAEKIESADTECIIDVDLHDGILTLETERGVFVVNRQSAAKEIWLSSPISGPYHFVFKDGNWISTKSGDDELFDLLFGEIGTIIKI